MTNADGFRVGSTLYQRNENDIISVEVDLRSDDPIERTLHFFCNSLQKEISFTHLPESVKFCINDNVEGDIQFLALEALKEPSVTETEDQYIYPFLNSE